MKKEVKNRGESFKWCYKTSVLMRYVCEFQKSAYLCTVFFIVLDLRLTKVGARRCSFFYVYMSRNGDIAPLPLYPLRLLPKTNILFGFSTFIFFLVCMLDLCYSCSLFLDFQLTAICSQLTTIFL